MEAGKGGVGGWCVVVKDWQEVQSECIVVNVLILYAVQAVVRYQAKGMLCECDR